ncbi:MAG: TonB-dependent receptor [Deltaproteobacteria bacterium]|nr:TonB-dependent receptor [Deltaproteobacteria bacterium]
MKVSAQARHRAWMSFPGILAALVLPSLAIVAVAVNVARSETVYPVLDPVVVTGTRIPRPLSQNGHAFYILSRKDIENSGANNVCDLLEFVSGTDVRQRGGHGIQADVSVRGGSYEQTLILIDGIPMADPQTGHHNMDLPVTPADIERIEVLKGPAARAYGHNAVAGVINIITRQADTTRTSANVAVGDYGYYRIGLGGSIAGRSAGSRISVSRRRSTGHLSDKPTDFDIKTLFYKVQLAQPGRNSGFTLGVVDKDFGAYGFYSDAFPEQREATRTLLVEGQMQINAANWRIEPRLFWRRHADDFKIQIADLWSENNHQSDVYSAQCHTRCQTVLGNVALGASLTQEALKSTNLGTQRRHLSEFFFEHRPAPFGRIKGGFGASVAHENQWGWRVCPGADLNATVLDGVNLFASMEKAYRIPTFTELWYYTPANQGNPDLKPEKSWTTEVGMRWNGEGFSADVAAFVRREHDVIDWNRSSGSDPWKARNISGGTTRGMEADVALYPQARFAHVRLRSVRLSYTYLDSTRDTEGRESKYALDHLRHQLIGTLTTHYSASFRSTIKMRYGKRMVGDSLFVVDASLAFHTSRAEFFIEANNVFDEAYVDGGFAPMAGRWIIGGIRIVLDPLSP